MTAKGLYTRDEISRMTRDALDELLSYYLDTGNLTGAERVQDEQLSRADDIELDRLDEMAWEADQEREQQLHDEMVDYDPGPEVDDMGGMSEVEWGHPIG